MTSATPKPRAGEQTREIPMELPEVTKALNSWQEMRNYNAELLAEQTRLLAERDLLRERERELVEALERACQALDHLGFDAKGASRADLEKRAHGYAKDARAALAKVQP